MAIRLKIKLISLSLLLLFLFSCSAKEASITVLDLREMNNLDLSNKANVELLWDVMHTTATLQGVVNRESPQLYIRYVTNAKGQNVDDYWWDKYRLKGEWLYGKQVAKYNDITTVIERFASSVKGAVVYDSNVASSSNIASAVAGIEDLIAVRYDNSPNSLYSKVISGGAKLPVKCWLVNEDGSSKFTGKGKIAETNLKSSGSVKIDPYLWFIEKYVKTGRCNMEYGAYYIDQYWRNAPERSVANHHQLTNHDFFVSKRAFFFDLSPWGDEAPIDDPTQKLGLDLELLKMFLAESYRQNGDGEKFCHIGGFPSWAYKYTDHVGSKHPDVPTEWEFSRIISAYNAFKDADAIGLGAYANASFWQHFPLEESYPQEWTTREKLKERGYLNSDGTINFAGRQFMIFYVGDYDASAWIAQTTPYIWDDPNRGQVPMMWCISPILAQRAPMAMHNFRVTATPNDYFASADNGAGYLLPGMLQEPREISGYKSGLDSWAKHCQEHYKKWGLTITGFVIDGEAPGLDNDGLDCYASFSPNGIVPQKIPLTLLHKEMPVIRADFDLVDHDPIKATEVILGRVAKRPIPFHWFRAILKTPTWYNSIDKELKRRETKIELLDAPTFFELYRIYLEQNEDAARGGIAM